MNGTYSFSQPASASPAAGSMGRPGQGMQQNGFTPQYAQQLQNHLLLQQSGAFPFLPPGAHMLPLLMSSTSVMLSWHGPCADTAMNEANSLSSAQRG